jgi:hypothetical protein
MPAAWDAEEPTEPVWSDPDAWRGQVHSADAGWSPEPHTQWGLVADQAFILEDELFEDEEDWCPGGWLEDWGDEGET